MTKLSDTLDASVDTMAFMMASPLLDDVKEFLHDHGLYAAEGALLKLEQDAGLQHEIIASDAASMSDLTAGVPEENILPEAEAIRNNFEPVTHERVNHVLGAIRNLLPEGDMRKELRALIAELSPDTPAAPSSATPAPRAP